MPQAFLVTIGAGFLFAVVKEVIGGRHKRILMWVAGVIAAVCLIAGLAWDSFPQPSAGSLRESVAQVATSFWSWFAIIGAFWAYLMLIEARRVQEVAALRNDVQAIAAVIQRGVMPRHLNKRQQVSIASFLKRFDPHDVSFKVLADDEEANGYASDLKEALTKSGWTITESILAEKLQPGLRTQFTHPQAQAQQPEDPKNPRSDRLLQMALGLAGVRFDGGGGSGSGIAITTTTLTVEVGRCRKDSYSIDPPPGLF